MSSSSLLLIAVIATLAISSQRGHAQSTPNGRVVSVEAPARINAGDGATVTVTLANVPDGARVNLLTQDTFGPLLFQTAASRNSATFKISSDETRAAGVATLVANFGASSAQASMTIQSGAPIEPLVQTIGARSIVADGKSWSMVVVVPTDALGNPVSDGVPVDVRANHPDGSADEQTAQVEHLIAWAKIKSRLVAGKTRIAVTSGDAHGPEGTLNEVAGWPKAFTISAFPSPIPADGRSVTVLKTSYMVDVNGNVVTDGTLVTFIVSGDSGGERRIPAIAVGGVAQASLVAPASAQSLDVWASVYSVESAHLTVRFSDGPAIGAVPVAATLDWRAGVVTIDAGPFIGPLGQYTADGLNVDFSISDSSGVGETVAAAVSAGHAIAQIRLADLAPGDYSVTASLGSSSGGARFSVPVQTAAASASSPFTDEP